MDKRIARYEFNLPEGAVVLTVPMHLSEESVDEVSSLFALVNKQLFRWSESRTTKPHAEPGGRSGE